MITEEQLATQWLHDTGWNYVHGAVIAPEGVAAEREALRTLTPALSHGEKEEDGRLAEAVRRLNPSISEEVSATHKDSLSVEIKSK